MEKEKAKWTKEVKEKIVQENVSILLISTKNPCLLPHIKRTRFTRKIQKKKKNGE